MPRFFITDKAITGEVVEITGSDFNHISHSLRLKKGDLITVSTGDGQDYQIKLVDFLADRITGKVIKKEKNSNEPGLKITLGQAIPKKNNLKLVIEKATEIGVNSIIPLITERTIVKLDDNRQKKRVERWQRIAEEAAKQSGRGIIPEIREILTLRELTGIKDDYDLIIIFWEEEKANFLKDTLDQIKDKEIERVLLIIGPEGGFAEEEVKIIKDMGGYVCSLGPRILRTETAGIVVLTILLYDFGDLGGV
jgi:16S rRNA (uracil1498-N3)-methyltransferase